MITGQHATTQQRAARIVAYLRDYSHDHGYPPTQREIAQHIGVNYSTIWHHLDRLRRAGRVTWRHRSPRSVRVTQ